MSQKNVDLADELERLLDGTTDAPWKWDKLRSGGGAPVIVGPHWGGRQSERVVCKVLFDPGSEDPQVHQNARLIVALRNLVPQIIAALRLTPDNGGVKSKALEDIAAERQRHFDVEGWTPEHDDEHKRGELAGAAACYILNNLSIDNTWLQSSVKQMVRELWPWAKSWWKPKDKRSDLVRAGSLIVAEIERLDRAALKSEARKEGSETC